MRKLTRWIGIGSGIAVLAAASVWLPGTLDARRAARAAALEANVLSRNIAFLEAKLAADSTNWLLGGHLADLYTLRFRADADLADVARAEQLARAAIPFRIERAAAYARLSSILLTQHRFDEAYDAARVAIDVPRPSEGALAAFVDAARAIGDNAAADSALAAMEQRSFAASVRWSDRFAGEGKVDAARSYVSRACERLHETGATREVLAWCLTKLAGIDHAAHGADAARVWLRRALRVQPEHRGATEMLADLAYAEQHWREARRLYERIAAPAHPDIFLRLAEVNRALGRNAVAVAHEQRFLTLAGAPDMETLNALPLALHFADAGRCAEASRLATRELARRHSAEAFERVAWIRFRCNDAAGAQHALAQAKSAASLSPSALYLEGLIRRAAGDEATAVALITRAVSDPTQLEHHVLEHLRRARGGVM